MANVVTVSETIPAWTTPQPFVQIDAPSGYCVIAAFGDQGNRLAWNAGGLASAFEIVLDDDDLITGVIFTNTEYGASFTGYITCLEIVP